MKIAQLFEYSAPELLSIFGAKLAQRYEEETHQKVEPEKLIQTLVANDPSPSKKYAFWTLSRYVKKLPRETNGYQYGIRHYEDILSRAYPALRRFEQLSKKTSLTPPMQVKDAFKFASLPELEKVIGVYNATVLQSVAATRKMKASSIKPNRLPY